MTERDWVVAISAVAAVICAAFAGHRAGWLRGRAVGRREGIEAARVRERQWSEMRAEFRKVTGR